MEHLLLSESFDSDATLVDSVSGAAQNTRVVKCVVRILQKMGNNGLNGIKPEMYFPIDSFCCRKTLGYVK